MLEPLIAEAEPAEQPNTTEPDSAEPNTSEPNSAEKVEPQSSEAVEGSESLVMADAPEDQPAARQVPGAHDGLAEPLLVGAAEPESA